jgi:hypothetical protein
MASQSWSAHPQTGPVSSGGGPLEHYRPSKGWGTSLVLNGTSDGMTRQIL